VDLALMRNGEELDIDPDCCLLPALYYQVPRYVQALI